MRENIGENTVFGNAAGWVAARMKQQMRADMLRRRDGLAAEERRAANHRIFSLLIADETYRRAAILHTFVSRPDEVDSQTLIAHALANGKQVIVPRVQRGAGTLQHFFIDSLSDLQPGHFGILEPDPEKCTSADPARAELILVPGVVFDRHGHRLGYGKGYYDRFLQHISAPTIGLAFALQVVDAIPAEPFDIPVQRLVTEKGIWIFSHRQDAAVSGLSFRQPPKSP